MTTKTITSEEKQLFVIFDICNETFLTIGSDNIEYTKSLTNAVKFPDPIIANKFKFKNYDVIMSIDQFIKQNF